MREIKYKAYLHFEKTIVDVIEINLQDNIIRYYDTTSCKDDAEIFELMRSAIPNADCPIENCNLMQYTNMIDGNGAEVYEGYIVMVTPMLVETIPTYKALVEWDKYRFALINLDYDKSEMFLYPMNNLDPFGLDIVIIGNIYKNPELLDKP